jgi:hypothetical protein
MSRKGTSNNPWTVFLVCLAGGGLLFGLGVAALPDGLLRSVAFWLTIGIALLAMVGAVGWGYTEIRIQERLSAPKATSERVLSYLGVLAIVAAIAVGAAMVPSRFAQLIWLFYLPAWLLGGLWLRRRSHRHSHGKHQL